jgi:hypothetical protein
MVYVVENLRFTHFEAAPDPAGKIKRLRLRNDGYFLYITSSLPCRHVSEPIYGNLVDYLCGAVPLLHLQPLGHRLHARVRQPRGDLL